MRKADLSEWMLSLVTDQDRARSIAGDLVESAVTRGDIWFWSSVSRTASSLLWRQFTRTPLRIAGVALYGVAFEAVVWFLLFVVTLLPLISLAFDWGGKAAAQYVTPDWGLYLVTFGLWDIVVPFLAGRMIARRARGQELAACVALTILQALVSVVVQVRIGHDDYELAIWWRALTIDMAFLMTGAVLVRRRSFTWVDRRGLSVPRGHQNQLGAIAEELLTIPAWHAAPPQQLTSTSGHRHAGFVAMEAFAWVWNRSVLVWLTGDGLRGWKFGGGTAFLNRRFYLRPFSPINARYYEPVEAFLNRPEIAPNSPSLTGLGEQRGTFFIRYSDIRTVEWSGKSPYWKFCMLSIRWSGKLTIETRDGKKRTFLLLGTQDGEAIRDAIRSKTL